MMMKMMMTMTKMFLAVLLFQLLIQSTAGEYEELQYGDILAFHREKFWKFPVNYSHFAIYIDNITARFPGRTEKGNLFHITGPLKKPFRLSGCVFGDIANEIKTTMKVQNYLDTMTNLSVPIEIGSEKNITDRINEVLRHCPRWLPKSQNCEHLATYIRYGLHVSLQFGECKEGKCRPGKRIKNKLSEDDEKKVISELRKLYNEKEEKRLWELKNASEQPGQADAASSG